MLPWPWLGEALQVGTVGVTALAALEGTKDVVVGLRAKSKAKAILSRNPELKSLLGEADSGTPSQLRDTIMRVLKEAKTGSKLSEREVRSLETGLTQQNSVGKRRYIKELTG